MCSQKGCIHPAYYNFPGENVSVFCVIHKMEGMVNVKNRVCNFLKCNKQPSFNYPDRSFGILCVDHKLPKMINVKKRRCSDKDCLKSAIYGDSKIKKKLWCKNHAPDGCINLNHSKRCELCSTEPSFNFPNIKTPKRCLKHSLPGMINVKNKRCGAEGCNKRAICRREGDKYKNWCKTHVNENVTGFRPILNNSLKYNIIPRFHKRKYICY